jgi:hypothetical protein
MFEDDAPFAPPVVPPVAFVPSRLQLISHTEALLLLRAVVKVHAPLIPGNRAQWIVMLAAGEGRRKAFFHARGTIVVAGVPLLAPSVSAVREAVLDDNAVLAIFSNSPAAVLPFAVAVIAGQNAKRKMAANQPASAVATYVHALTHVLSREAREAVAAVDRAVALISYGVAGSRPSTDASAIPL